MACSMAGCEPLDPLSIPARRWQSSQGIWLISELAAGNLYAYAKACLRWNEVRAYPPPRHASRRLTARPPSLPTGRSACE